MKMQEVIGAAREASPLVNEQISAVRQMLEQYGALLVDLGNVQSEAGRQSMVQICRQGLENMRGALDSLDATWQGFDATLRGYKRRFKVRTGPKDAPGQMLFPDMVPENPTVPEVGVLRDPDDPGYFDSPIGKRP